MPHVICEISDEHGELAKSDGRIVLGLAYFDPEDGHGKQIEIHMSRDDWERRDDLYIWQHYLLTALCELRGRW